MPAHSEIVWSRITILKKAVSNAFFGEHLLFDQHKLSKEHSNVMWPWLLTNLIKTKALIIFQSILSTLPLCSSLTLYMNPHGLKRLSDAPLDDDNFWEENSAFGMRRQQNVSLWGHSSLLLGRNVGGWIRCDDYLTYTLCCWTPVGPLAPKNWIQFLDQYGLQFKYLRHGTSIGFLPWN